MVDFTVHSGFSTSLATIKRGPPIAQSHGRRTKYRVTGLTVIYGSSGTSSTSIFTTLQWGPSSNGPLSSMIVAMPHVLGAQNVNITDESGIIEAPFIRLTTANSTIGMPKSVGFWGRKV